MKTRLLKGAVNVTFALAIIAWVYLVAVVPVVESCRVTQVYNESSYVCRHYQASLVKYTIDRIEVGILR